MARVVVTVVPVAAGRFAILLLDPTAAAGRESCPAKDANGYTETELRPILKSCYGLSESEIEDSIVTARRSTSDRALESSSNVVD
jgi:hypothetical protein